MTTTQTNLLFKIQKKWPKFAIFRGKIHEERGEKVSWNCHVSRSGGHVFFLHRWKKLTFQYMFFFWILISVSFLNFSSPPWINVDWSDKDTHKNRNAHTYTRAHTVQENCITKRPTTNINPHSYPWTFTESHQWLDTPPETPTQMDTHTLSMSNTHTQTHTHT